MALKKTVRELLTGQPGPLSIVELVYWKAFDRIDPFGEARADLRAATVAATVANCHRSKDSDPAKISDFMFEYRPPVELNDRTREQVALDVDRYFGALVLRQQMNAAPAECNPTTPSPEVS